MLFEGVEEGVADGLQQVSSRSRVVTATLLYVLAEGRVLHPPLHHRCTTLPLSTAILPLSYELICTAPRIDIAHMHNKLRSESSMLFSTAVNQSVLIKHSMRIVTYTSVAQMISHFQLVKFFVVVVAYIAYRFNDERIQFFSIAPRFSASMLSISYALAGYFTDIISQEVLGPRDSSVSSPNDDHVKEFCSSILC